LETVYESGEADRMNTDCLGGAFVGDAPHGKDTLDGLWSRNRHR